MIRGRSNIVTLTNNSGGALVAGDVCIQDTSADENVTTTTSAASVLKVFVAAEAIASAAAGKFYESGYCPLVNVNASVTRGRFLFTHTVAKQAAENATYGAGAFGKILKSGTTPSAIIYSATAQVAGGGTIGGSSGSTDNAVIRADGTGGATVQSSLATIDDNGTINIPTGQTYNINSAPHAHTSVLLDVFNATDNSVITANSGTDWTLLTTTQTFRAGTYYAICKLFVNTVGQGGLGMKMDGVAFGSTADARNAGEYTLFGTVAVTAASHTLIINYNREAASGVFGLSTDPRWGRAVTIIGPIA